MAVAGNLTAVAGWSGGGWSGGWCASMGRGGGLADIIAEDKARREGIKEDTARNQKLSPD